MNPLFLLLGFLGLSFAGSSSSSNSGTPSSSDGQIPIFDPDDGMDMGDDDGGMDMGGDDGDMDMGGDDGGMDMGGDDGDMDMGDDDGDMDMGDDDGDMDMGDDDGDMDMGDDDDPHAGHDHGNGSSDDDDDDGMDMDDDDGDMDMGGDDDHNHGDMGTPAITPPGIGASQSEINSYINALNNLDETHIHDASSSMAGEHAALIDLVPRDEATHVAIGNGDWDDASTWSNGEVPGDDARVLIPDGVAVDYSGISDARLFTVRVDGSLDFATDSNSQMIFDTFVVSPDGHLTMGTADNPVQPNVDIDLIVANNGPIDTDWDPMLLSRGLISHGDVTVHGAEKDSHEKVDEDPMAGDTSVSFASAPEGWQVGDTIVIAGTHYDGYTYSKEADGEVFYPPEDEVRVITEIVGNDVFFEDALIYDHDAPRDDLSTSVANYTRNVSIETENGAEAEVFERGHVMFMHSDDVDVRFMEFTELGRTDKSEESFSVDDINNIESDSNVQGRYALHLHRTGTTDPEDPTILEGNAVFDSPGWGIVHHDSNAIIDNNATYDTFGAGFVAETGNEIGIWSDNIAIFAQGVDWGIPKNTSITDDNFDTARGGEGFWFQGRMVASVDNIAASVNTGFSYFHRGDGMIDFDSALFDFSDALYNDTSVTADDVPIMIFEGNETFAAREGLHVVKSNTAQGHDVWSRLDDFTAWSVMNGVELEYTSHYILSNFDLTAREPDTFSQPNDGITFGNNLTEIIVIDSRIEGFENGMDLNKSLTHRPDSDVHDYFIINTEIVNVENDFINRDDRDTVLDNTPSSNYSVDIDIETSRSEFGGVSITGTKSDGLGETDIPGGMDEFTIDRDELINILDTKGYWSTSSGQDYTLIDIYFTDRLTGDIFYETTPVMLDDYPVGDKNANAGVWADNVYNGVQSIGNFDPVAVPAPTIETMTPSIDALTSSSSMVNAMVHSSVQLEGAETSEMHSDMGMMDMDDDMIADMMMSSDQEDEAMPSDMMMEDAPDMDASRTLAVFEAAAQVDLNGEVIETSEAEEPEVEVSTKVCATGIDLGSNMSIDLAGLSAEDGTAFTQMSSEEISDIFNKAGGLDDMDARIVVDYESDKVSMELVAGKGAVSVETIGGMSDDQALWASLTAGQGVVCEMGNVEDDEEDLMLSDVA